MCEINWDLTAVMLYGIGTLLFGLAAILTLFIQHGFRAKPSYYRAALILLMRSYQEFLATEEGIVWGDYPEDSEKIIAAISRRTGKNETCEGTAQRLTQRRYDLMRILTVYRKTLECYSLDLGLNNQGTRRNLTSVV